MSIKNSQNHKQDNFSGTRMLTPSEIESLRKDAEQTITRMKAHFRKKRLMREKAASK